MSDQGYEGKHEAVTEVDEAQHQVPVAVPAGVRTAVYLTALILNVVTVTGFGLAAVFEWIDPTQASAAVGVILGGVNILSTGLALGYRPTRPGL